MIKKRIYLDNAASTPVDADVARHMLDSLTNTPGNPSSPHHEGQQARILIEEARDAVAAMLGSESRDIFFTSGGTEANNSALMGLARAMQNHGRHILSTRVEHPSVRAALEALEKEGFSIDYLKPGADGNISPASLNGLLRDDTILVSVMYVNNETGIIHPVREIAGVLTGHRALFHVDAIQAFGKLDFDVSSLPCDALSFSAHKIHGPKGIGGLFLRHGTPFRPRALGGGQEANRRAGTENISGIAGLHKAIELCRERPEHRRQARRLQKHFEQGLREIYPGALILGEQTLRSPYISAIALPGIDNQSLLLNLDLQGVAVSVGSACSSGSIKPSHVIRAISEDETIVNSTIRVSYNRYQTIEDMDEALMRFKTVLNR